MVFPLLNSSIPLADPGTFTLFSFAFFMAIAIPIVALIYGGIKLIFRFKANDKAIGLTGLVLWVLSVICVVTITAYDDRGADTSGQTTESNYLTSFNSDTLMVYMQKDPGIENFRDEWYYNDDEEWHIISDADKTYGKINIDVVFTDDRKFELLVRKKSQGKSRVTAMINAENLIYRHSQNGNNLYLDPYFSLNKIHKWKSPETEIMIRVPEGKYIYLDENTRFFLDEIEGVPAGSEQEAAGKVLPFEEIIRFTNLEIQYFPILHFFVLLHHFMGLTYSVIGNTSDFGSEESRFEPW